jgi:hypothetical protein
VKSFGLIMAVFVAATGGLWAQEAGSGFDLRATVSAAAFNSNELTQDPRNGSSVDAGFRAVVYPTLKIDEHWTLSAAWQTISRPYFYETYSTQGRGIETGILNATVNYSRTARWGAVIARAGEMPTAFGSFPIHYDDMENPLFDKPLEYGYYYAPVSTLAVAAAQLDVSSGKWDARAQFANSSPGNPRSLTARDQYGNWAGGAGYTIRQGFRVGASAYRGPYLYRAYPYFFPGEANPNTLPAHAIGADVQFARGHWYASGEIQRFVFPYKAIPTYRAQAGYFEVKRVLHPRWYVAGRVGYQSSTFAHIQSFEVAAGYRPGANQLIKLDYELDRESGSLSPTLAVQFVTTVHPLAIAFR